MFVLPYNKQCTMQGTIKSLTAKIGDIIGIDKILRRKVSVLVISLLSMSRRRNFKQIARHTERCESTIHNWYASELNLKNFNVELVAQHGSGVHCVVFDPSFISKSGKHTPKIDFFWSGGEGRAKRGLELGAFAIADIEQHVAYHLAAHLTPGKKERKESGVNLMKHYVSLVKAHKDIILGHGGILVADGYFGVSTFVNPVLKLGIDVLSCLKSNACLHFLPVVPKKRGRGRPPVKGEKVNWSKLDEEKMPLVLEDAEKRVRTGMVWVKCLRRVVRLVAVEYLNKKGEVTTRKLYFCTDKSKDWQWVLKRYGVRFQIEFIFRDAKQYLGLMHCQSRNETKLENHMNLALTTRNVAYVAHKSEGESKAFSMAEIVEYYQKLNILEQFSDAFGISKTQLINNPKILKILLPSSYDNIAA